MDSELSRLEEMFSPIYTVTTCFRASDCVLNDALKLAATNIPVSNNLPNTKIYESSRVVHG